MAELPYVCLYARYLDTLEPFTDAERGRIMTAMLSYSIFGEIPVFEGNEKFIWPTIKAQIDRDAEAYQKRCERNRANGSKGGRPKNQTDNAETEKTERFSEEPKKANTNTNTNTNTKSNNKKDSHTLFQSLISAYNIPENLRAKMAEWITYKTERKEPYKEQGMKSLLRQIENNCLQYGDQAVCDLIDESMASGWKGIIFDRLKQNNASNNRQHGRKEKLPSWYTKPFEAGAAEQENIRRLMAEENESQEAQAEREKLEKELQAFGRKAQ